MEFQLFPKIFSCHCPAACLLDLQVVSSVQQGRWPATRVLTPPIFSLLPLTLPLPISMTLLTGALAGFLQTYPDLNDYVKSIVTPEGEKAISFLSSYACLPQGTYLR